MTKILVTGGAGFIGMHTVNELHQKGYDVRVLDNLDRQVHRSKVIPDFPSDVEFIQGDIRYKKHWMRALSGIDGIIHLAGSVGISQSFWQARKYMEVNSGGTATLFEILAKEKQIRKNITKVVVASSKSIYGEGSYICKTDGLIYPEARSSDQLSKKEWEVKCPICGENLEPTGVKENKPVQNLNPYSLSKYSTEKLALDFSYALSIPAVALRYFNVYGEGQSLSNPYTGVIAIFLSRIKNGNRPIVFEDGKQSRDFIYVKDVAKINAMSLEKGSGAINVGTGKSTSLLQMIDIINRDLGTDIKADVTEEFRAGDNRHDFADLSTFRKNFGSFDFTPLDRGMASLDKWAADQEAIDMVNRAELERKKYLSKV